jgi:hypothetical protein
MRIHALAEIGRSTAPEQNRCCRVPRNTNSNTEKHIMKFSVSAAALVSVLSLAAALEQAHAGLGAYSSPQRTRCENQASAKIAMWQWFTRQDFVNRCVAATGTNGSGKGKAKSRKVTVR